MRESHILRRILTCYPALHVGIGKVMFAFAFVLTPLASCTSVAWDDGKNNSQDRLEAIAEAICDYRDVWGEFPPPAIFDADGQPLHSWRALIVPYLEKNWFADAYRRDEPWNGRHNRQLLTAHYEGSGENRHDVTGVRSWFVWQIVQTPL